MKKVLKGIKYFVTNADMLLLSLCTASSIYGIVLIYSATRYTESNRFIFMQVAGLLLGIFIFIIFSIIDAEMIMNKWKWIFIFSIGLNLLLIPFGTDLGTGNRSWMYILGVSVQPAEIAKVCYALLFAKQLSWLRERNGGINSPLSVIQMLAHLLLFLALIIAISSDTGVALIYIFIFLFMVIASGLHPLWFVGGLAGFAASIPLLWNYILRDDQKERILAPYNSSIDPSGLGVLWHTNRSKLAIGSGGFSGMGYLQGTQTQAAAEAALPFRHSDFIFAVAGEELGFIGGMAIILLLLFIILRIIHVGIKSRNYAGMLICCGFAGMMFFQTFENIGMCLGLTPVIGVALPFFSYGGTSIVTLFAAMGIVSSVKMHPTPTHNSRWNKY